MITSWYRDTIIKRVYGGGVSRLSKRYSLDQHDAGELWRSKGLPPRRGKAKIKGLPRERFILLSRARDGDY
ncbi:hypothetical protein ANTRET_LOCUS1543 [Anthophora retusa]